MIWQLTKMLRPVALVTYQINTPVLRILYFSLTMAEVIGFSEQGYSTEPGKMGRMERETEEKGAPRTHS